MDHFIYKNNKLYVEDVMVSDLIEKFATPFYVYSRATINHHINLLKSLFDEQNSLICFAIKSNSNQAVLTEIAKHGLGADIVSIGELKRALKAGFASEKIVFSGVGKTKDEIRYAIEKGIKQFNVESVNEFYVILAEAEKLKKVANIALRVNPDVDAGTLQDITTGTKVTKFGILAKDIEPLYEAMSNHKYVKPAGLAMHLGSQILTIEPYIKAWNIIADLALELKNKGYDVPTIDLGGGLGISYHENEKYLLPSSWAEAAMNVAHKTGCDIIVEPGRMIVGNAGIMVTKITYMKEAEDKTFMIVDAGMNDLIRPAMYKAEHNVIPINKVEKDATKIKVDIVGPICESTDIFAKSVDFFPMKEGESIAIRTAGAYGAVLSNSYNSRALIAEILVDGDNYFEIRKRVSIEEIISYDFVPELK